MKMASKAVPTVRVVVADGPAASAVVVDAFEVAAPQQETAGMLSEIAQAVASRAKGLAVGRAVVRRADKSQRPNNQEGPRVRLLTEGAVAAALRPPVPAAVIRDGDHCAALLGVDKATMQAQATALLAAAGHPAKYDEPAAAALAGLAT